MIENRSAHICDQIQPFVPDKRRRPVTVAGDVIYVSYGKEETGYGITLRDDLELRHGYAVLGVSHEHVAMSNRHTARIIGKSTWARLGIHPNVTEIEPGWRGYVTLELTYIALWRGLLDHWKNLVIPPSLILPAGTGIGVLQFADLAEPAQYAGNYQDQPPVPITAYGCAQG